MDAWQGYDYCDRFGVVQTVYGCSSVGIFEFVQRIGWIESVLAAAGDDVTWQQLFLSDKFFAHAIRRALELNGIDPDGVTLPQISVLLFPQAVEGGYIAGRLVALNMPDEDGRVMRPDAEPATADQAVAVIATHSTSISEALEVAQTVPAKQVQAVMREKNRLERLQTEEGRKAEEAKKNRKKAKKQLEEMRRAALPNGLA